MPLVSIVTPTIPGREEVLLERCMPSVHALDWPSIEHVIVSDPNPELEIAVTNYRLANRPTQDQQLERHTRFVQINNTWRDGTREKSVGAIPWYVGSLLAQGEFIGFLGDDDQVLPEHVMNHVNAMRAVESMFSVGRVQFIVDNEPQFVIGDDTFMHGHLDATGIMCHKEALRVASWTATGEDAADYRLVRDWLEAGLRGTFVDAPFTVLHHDGWAARA